DLGTGTGWRGPYIETKQDDSGTYLATLDGWGTAYTYNSATGQVTSLGSDGAGGGSGFAADITVPETAQTTTGSANGRVLDQVGNPVRSTTVTIRHPNPASLGNPTDTTDTTDANGNFSFTGIPIGKHRIQVTVGTETLKRVVVVLPGQTVNTTLQASNDPTIPSSVSSPAATGAAPTQINLTWTPPTTNTDSSSLIDLAGYHIYRSTTGGFTPGAANLVASIGLASSYADQTISFGTTYYYHTRPVDKAGNIDTASTQVSAQGINGTGSIVQVTPATVSGGANPSVSFNIWNTTGSGITVTSVNFNWSGSPPANYDRVNFAGGANEDTDTTSSGVCNNLATTSTVAAGATVSLDIRFTGAVGTNQNIQINLHTTGACGGTNASNGLIVR
ncbi:MAG: carboxypeptidase regulatory-like domain-containing protein, partial [candidate division NC10 bacterium]|nr:carboxypeptidase regulatory-like domain-containing protein [candidate division NC10 bacterium]